jgi:hypothetical protein
MDRDCASIVLEYCAPPPYSRELILINIFCLLRKHTDQKAANLVWDFSVPPEETEEI